MVNVHELLISHPERYKQLKAKDLLLVHYHCPQDIEKLDLYTRYNIIAYTISGERTIHRPGRSFRLTRGKCVFIKKGAYKQQKFHDADWCLLAFFMPDNYLQRFVKKYRSIMPLKNVIQQPQDLVMEINVNDTTKAFFYGLLPYLEGDAPPPEDLLELKFRELLFNILSNQANAALLSYVCSMGENPKPPLQEIMESNYLFNLSLKEFSKISHRSLASFKREFTELFQTTPGRWLTEKRLQHAKMLLQTSEKNVNEIAYESGFENNTHFNKIFKEKFGVPPLQYRKRKLIHQLYNAETGNLKKIKAFNPSV